MGIFNEANLNNVLRAIASGLKYPVIALLLVLMAASVILAGGIIAEALTERRHLKVHMPALVDALRSPEGTVAETIAASGLLKRQKVVLTELTAHPELSADMRQALAVRLLEEEQARYERIVSLSDMISKLGPMFGLLGTLIPLGPGIIALGQGDTYALSQSLLTAFDTTIAGLVCAAIATVISTIRKGWYSDYMSILEALSECVLEVVNGAQEG